MSTTSDSVVQRRWASPSPDHDVGFEHVPPALGTADDIDENEEAVLSSSAVLNQSMDSLIDGQYGARTEDNREGVHQTQAKF
jgi:hypothetical protein